VKRSRCRHVGRRRCGCVGRAVWYSTGRRLRLLPPPFRRYSGRTSASRGSMIRADLDLDDEDFIW